jgi:hypothetical protein
MVLCEKQLPCCLLDLQKFEHLTPAYLESERRRTLVHLGRPVIESNVIIEYLDETFRRCLSYRSNRMSGHG